MNNCVFNSWCLISPRIPEDACEIRIDNQARFDSEPSMNFAILCFLIVLKSRLIMLIKWNVCLVLYTLTLEDRI